MKTTIKKKKPTKAQLEAAEKARSYMSRIGQIEEDTVEDDGVITLETSDRDSAGDDEPSEQLVKHYRGHAEKICALSPLLFVSLEPLDEWIYMKVKVRAKPRKEKPGSVDNLATMVQHRLPDAITKHGKLKAITGDMSRDSDGMVAVKTSITGIGYGKDLMWIRLSWQLRGSSIEGWTLFVKWGVHTITRPATFKKLTPAIVLKQLDIILSQLADPFDAMGWLINSKNPDGSFLTENRTYPRLVEWDTWSVRNNKTGALQIPRGDDHVVVFTNRYTGQVLERGKGGAFPSAVLPLKLDENSLIVDQRTVDRAPYTVAGRTSDGIPVYYGKKDPEDVTTRDLDFWVTMEPEQIHDHGKYLRAFFVERSLEAYGDSYAARLAKWETIIQQRHSSVFAEIIKQHGGKNIGE